MLWQPRGVLGLVERGPWRSCELQGGVAIAPTEAWREGVQAILPPSWTSALSSSCLHTALLALCPPPWPLATFTGPPAHGQGARNC